MLIRVQIGVVIRVWKITVPAGFRRRSRRTGGNHRFEMDDPRLGSVNVTNADVSSDMRTAHVKVAIEAGQEKKGARSAGARQRFF